MNEPYRNQDGSHRNYASALDEGTSADGGYRSMGSLGAPDGPEELEPERGAEQGTGPEKAGLVGTDDEPEGFVELSSQGASEAKPRSE